MTEMTKMTVKISILVSGRGTNLQSVIDAIESGEIQNAEIACVISDKKEAYALQRAEKHGIEGIFVNPADFSSRAEYDNKVLEILKEKETDLVLLAGYLRIISDDLINEFKNKIINIHPSLLPSFKGLNAQKQAIEYGVKFTGCTVHFVEPDLDAGPIIMQKIIQVLEDDTPETLAERLLVEENKAYREVVKLFVDEKLEVDGRKVRIKN
ncbi:Phosphoribosylglycinamide formyltransferase [Methanimicrococcus hongohii]|uniref:phosphoribosylglycinamide formyltransferase 1 n=1 Tax=Methanimicrococcus hongohii TaxID=3028295 RepID=A0AA96UZU8_9EURY|nr:phosphoribosylglycinamide formyltransferase [Methanimicrococcus sp. Hf6]WNY23757.1 Phosphoribosylglycinamide formyltransferase [Methanimicrococcus sp. Hf6]